MSFITNGGSYEWKIKNGANTFGAENLCGGTLRDGLYDKITIGNVISRELNLKLWDFTIDPTKPIVLKLDKVAADGTITEIGKGTYFVDTIEKSPYSEYSTVHAYDALLKTEVPYMVTGEFEETTDYALAMQIASDIGVGLESGTEGLLAASPITINQLPSIGDNGTTDREILSVIGCLRGGNWIINDGNELQLVLLSGLLTVYPSVVIRDSDGDLATKPCNVLDSSDLVVSFDGNGDFDVIAFSSVSGSTRLWYVGTDGLFYADTWTNIQAIAPVDPNQTIVIGDEVVQFDVSPTETIKRVEVWAGSSTSFRSPSDKTQAEWEAIGGIVLSCQMPIMASQDLADDLRTAYENLTYIPYKADQTYFDPDTPLGTKLTIKNDTVVLSQRTLNIDVLASCDLEADATEAVTSYYPYLSPVEREIKREVKESYASISVADEAIKSEVVRAQGAESELGTRVTQTKDEILQEFWDAEAEQRKYIRYSAAGIELGEENSNFKAQLSNSELAFTGADGQKAAWISNTQLNIEEAVIRTDEKFVASSGNWVQQVVDDQFQIKWVAN